MSGTRILWGLSLVLTAGALAGAPAAAAAVQWAVDADGFWDVGGSWIPHYPGESDDVTIDRPAVDVVVSHRQGADTIRTLNCADALDVYGGSLTVREWAKIKNGTSTVSGGGALVVNKTMTLENGTLEIGPGGTFVVGDDGSLIAKGPGSMISGDGSTTVDGANLTAEDGANVDLSGVSSYIDPSKSYSHASFKADGSGSLLNLSGLTVLKASTSYHSLLSIDAVAGGRVDLSGVEDFDTGAAAMKADAGILDLSALRTFFPTNPPYHGSSMEASNGGVILSGNLIALDRVNLIIDGTGTMDTGQIERYVRGTATIQDSSPDFSGMMQVDSSRFEVTHGSLGLTSATNIDGASFFAYGGAVISVPAATHYRNQSTSSDADTWFEADGGGSLVDFSSLISLAGATTSYSELFIEAHNGGEVKLPGVSTFSTGCAVILAQDAGSVVDLTGLSVFTPSNPYGTTSRIEAHWGGEVKTPNLIALDGVNLTILGTGMMNTGQIERYTNGTARTEDSSPDFSAMENVAGSRFDVTRAPAPLALSSATNIDGASFIAKGDSQVLVPAAAHYRNPSTASSSDTQFTADGAGSLVDLSSLTSLAASTGNYSELTIDAHNGGKVDLSGVPSFSTGCAVVLAEGLNSIVDLSGLANFTPSNPYQTFSSIEARWGGEVKMGNLTTLDRVDLNIYGTGTMETSQIERYTRGTATIEDDSPLFSALENAAGSRFEVKHGALDLPSAANINGATFIAENSQITVPAATHYTNPSTASSSDTWFKATGVASLVDIPLLSTLAGSTASYSEIFIEAHNGGRVNLPAVPSFITGAAAITASGGGIVDLSGLVSFTPTNPSGTASSIEPREGGQVMTPNLTTVDRVNLMLDGSGTMDTMQIKQYTNGTATISNHSPDFSALENAAGSRFEVANTPPGSPFDLPSATNIDRASFIASNAGISVLAATHYRSTGYDSDTLFKAEHMGSFVDLSGLISLGGSTENYSQMTIEATNGAEVRLPGVGVFETGAATVKATGVDSVVDLSGLTSFTPTNPYGTTSSIEARWWGQVKMANLVTLDRVNLNIYNSGIVDTRQIQRYTNGTAKIEDSRPDFSGMENVAGSRFEAIRSYVDLPSATNLDGATFIATDGRLLLPAATHYSNPNNSSPEFRAEGASSLIDLSSLSSLAASTASYSRLSVNALNGGRIDLGGVRNFDRGAAVVIVDGANSLVDLSQLRNFIPTYPYGSQSSLTARNGGKINLGPGTVTMARTQVTAGEVGTIEAGTLELHEGMTVNVNGVMRLSGDLNLLHSDATCNVVGGTLVLNGPSSKVLVGKSGSGVFNLGDASRQGTINETGPGTGSDMTVREGVGASGTFSGWGTVGLTGELENNGRIIADGYGVNRILDLSSFSSITNDDSRGIVQGDGTTPGWYAQNRGQLVLPSVSVATGSNTYNSGEDPADSTIDLVNSVRAAFTNVTLGADLSIDLLATDHAYVPDVGDGWLIGVWEFSSPVDLTFDSVDLTFRYDDSLASSIPLEESALLVYQFTDRWTDVTSGIDTTNKWIYANDVDSFSVFGVGLGLPPTPNEWKLTGGGSYNDFSNWTLNIVPNGVDAVANFLTKITADSLVSVDSPVTVGTINFDNTNGYTLEGSAAITLETSSGDARINVEAGDHTISTPLLLAGGLTVETQIAASLTLTQNGYLDGTLTKTGGGSLTLGSGLVLVGEINLDQGLLQVGPDVLSVEGPPLNLAHGTMVKAAGVINRRVINTGDPRTSTLQAEDPMAVDPMDPVVLAVGVLDDPNGYDFQGHLEVGVHNVGLMDADKAQVYETHIDGGSLSSFNGIALQPVPDFWLTLVSHEGWVTGRGTISGAVRLETDVLTGDMAAIAGDGPDDMIVLDGIVSGSGWFEFVKITGLHRPGASAGATSLGPGFDIGPSTAMGIDGPVGFDLPNPTQNPQRGYDQWFAAMGVHSISGDLTINLEEGFMPSPGDRFEIFKSFAPGGNSAAVGWYVDWFSNVTLDDAWPTTNESLWEFEYKDGGTSVGHAPDAGREFFSASLFVVPEPGTLVLFLSGGLGLLIVFGLRRQPRRSGSE